MSQKVAERSWSVALRSKSADELEIVVYDVIGKDFWGEGIDDKQFLAQLRAKPDAKKISMRVNCIGGVVVIAKQMVNVLAERAAAGVEIEATVDGIAASAASYLLTAATRVIMPSNTFLMLHDVRASVRGRAKDMEEAAEFFRRENDQLAEGFAAASARRGKGKTKADFLAAFEKGDLYLDADQAIEWGLADQKLEPIKLVACLADLDLLKGDAPEALLSAPYLARGAARGVDPSATQLTLQLDTTQAEQKLEALERRAVAVRAAIEAPTTPAVPPVASTGTTRDNREGTNTMKTIALATLAVLLGFSAEQAATAEEKDVLDSLDKLKKKADAPPAATVNVGGVALLGVATEGEAATKVNELQRAELRLLAGTGKGSLAEAMVVVDAWKTDAIERPKDAKKIADLTEEVRVSKRDGAIARLSQSGHLPPARHEWAKQKFTTADALESFFEGMPVNFLNGTTEQNDENAAVTLTASERETCAKVGISEEMYLEQKKLDMKRGNARVGG